MGHAKAHESLHKPTCSQYVYCFIWSRHVDKLSGQILTKHLDAAKFKLKLKKLDQINQLYFFSFAKFKQLVCPFELWS